MSPIFLMPVGIVAILAGARVIGRAVGAQSGVSSSPMFMFSFVGLPLLAIGISILGGVICAAR